MPEDDSWRPMAASPQLAHNLRGQGRLRGPALRDRRLLPTRLHRTAPRLLGAREPDDAVRHLHEAPDTGAHALVDAAHSCKTFDPAALAKIILDIVVDELAAGPSLTVLGTGPRGPRVGKDRGHR